MYSDQVEAEIRTRKTVKNRLSSDSSSRTTRKRERQDDDKWEHDLFDDDDDKPPISTRRVDPRDLRLKLQKKHRGLQSGQGVRDLRQKLSRTIRPAMKNVARETKSETRTARKKSLQADASVGSFLESLGLEKYSTSFQVEEVDMDALVHMTDDDLKALLLPMGPRKKILLALGSKRG